MNDRENEIENGGNHLSRHVEMDHWLRLLVVTATTLLLLALGWVLLKVLVLIGHTLLIFSLGGLLAYALDPLVEWLRKGKNGVKRSRSLSALSVFGALFFLLITASILLGTALVRQVNMVAHDHSRYLEGTGPNATPELRRLAAQTYEARLEDRIAAEDRWLRQHKINLDIEKSLHHPLPAFKTIPNKLVNNVLEVVSNIGRTLAESAIVALIALYFLIFSEEMKPRFNAILPPPVRPYAERWEEDVNHILGGFVRGQLILAITLGALGGGLCAILGIHLWLLIGLFIMVTSLIPVVGPYIGAVPAIVSALITPSGHFLTPIMRVIILVTLFIVINEFGSKVLYPKLVGQKLGLHEVLVLFVLFAGLEVGGITGMLFAAPLTALAITTLPQLYRLWQGLPPISLIGIGHSETDKKTASP